MVVSMRRTVHASDEGGDPVRLVLRDRPLPISIILWMIADVLPLYF